MAKLKKDEKKVQIAQHAYDDGVDHFLTIIQSLNIDIIEICDLIHGYTMRWDDEKYDLTNSQFNALKDQRTFWLSFVKAPDKVLEHINNELREKHRGDAESKSASSSKKNNKSNVAQFSMNAD